MSTAKRGLPVRIATSCGRALATHLYLQVFVGMIAGTALGYLSPHVATEMKPFGDAFIKLIKMLVAPIVFCTVVHGIASVGDARKVGRIGLKSLAYFEVLTCIALLVGLFAMRLAQPGVGLNIDPATLQSGELSGIAAHVPHTQSVTAFLLDIIPDTFVGAFARGEILQVLFSALLFAFALSALGDAGKPLLNFTDQVAKCFFATMAIVMKAAPAGAFGAMAFTIGRYGIGYLLPMLHLVLVYYATCCFFVIVVLGAVCWISGFNIWHLIRYLRDELLIVLGTSSSEAVLPMLIAKLQALGIEKSVVSLVVPAGYSFNLDGTCINLAALSIFIAQATNTPMSFAQQLGLLAILMLTSKGTASVTGGSLVVLAATFASTGILPVSSIAIVLGVFRFISEAGALVNAIGNAVATIVIAKWEGAVDEAQFSKCLRGGLPQPRSEAAEVGHEVPSALDRGYLGQRVRSHG